MIGNQQKRHVEYDFRDQHEVFPEDFPPVLQDGGEPVRQVAERPSRSGFPRWLYFVKKGISCALD